MFGRSFPQNHQFEFDGITVYLQRKSIKHVYFRIYPPHAELHVHAPKRMKMRHITNALDARRDWIHKHRAQILSCPQKSVPQLTNGELHALLGTDYPLQINETAGKSHVELAHGFLCLNVPEHATLHTRQILLDRFYRKTMEDLLPGLIEKWERIVGVTVYEWRIRTMKTRWGSCNIRAHRICLNLNLIQKPLPCLESVLVHELVHLLEKNHNARFYQFMDQFMPDWRTHQACLSSKQRV